MKKKTAEEIVEILSKYCLIDQFGEDYYDLSELKLGECPVVHSEGNEEGGGEYSETVRHFKEHDVYIRIRGTYYSYDGIHWTNRYEIVSPKEKLVTVYE